MKHPLITNGPHSPLVAECRSSERCSGRQTSHTQAPTESRATWAIWASTAAVPCSSWRSLPTLGINVQQMQHEDLSDSKRCDACISLSTQRVSTAKSGLLRAFPILEFHWVPLVNPVTRAREPTGSIKFSGLSETYEHQAGVSLDQGSRGSTAAVRPSGGSPWTKRALREVGCLLYVAHGQCRLCPSGLRKCCFSHRADSKTRLPSDLADDREPSFGHASC